MTTVSADRRIGRTKRSLHRALLELMVEKGYEQASIQDIVDRADVGRSTFYTHYADKDDLLRESVGELGHFLRAATGGDAKAEGHAALSFSLPMLEHMVEMRDLSAALFASNGMSAVHRYVHEMLGAMVRERLPATPLGGLLPAAVVSAYVVESFLVVARWWLVDAPKRSPAEVHRIFLGLVGPTLERR